jgi:hypothetical protein
MQNAANRTDPQGLVTSGDPIRSTQRIGHQRLGKNASWIGPARCESLSLPHGVGRKKSNRTPVSENPSGPKLEESKDENAGTPWCNNELRVCNVRSLFDSRRNGA